MTTNGFAMRDERVAVETPTRKKSNLWIRPTIIAIDILSRNGNGAPCAKSVTNRVLLI